MYATSDDGDDDKYQRDDTRGATTRVIEEEIERIDGWEIDDRNRSQKGTAVSVIEVTYSETMMMGLRVR